MITSGPIVEMVHYRNFITKNMVWDIKRDYKIYFYRTFGIIMSCLPVAEAPLINPKDNGAFFFHDCCST